MKIIFIITEIRYYFTYFGFIPVNKIVSDKEAENLCFPDYPSAEAAIKDLPPGEYQIQKIFTNKK